MLDLTALLNLKLYILRYFVAVWCCYFAERTGKPEPFNENYSFDQMEVTIYKDQACTLEEQVLTTDANGFAKSRDLYYGVYYVRETKPPKGYRLCDHTYEVEIGNVLKVDGRETDTVELSFADETIRKPVMLQKYDRENGTGVPNNKAVTFQGAEYTIYADEAMTEILEVLTADENGKAESKAWPYGTYYVKETKTPAGYLPDELVYKVVIDDIVTVNGAAMDVIENKAAVVPSYPHSCMHQLKRGMAPPENSGFAMPLHIIVCVFLPDGSLMLPALLLFSSLQSL